MKSTLKRWACICGLIFTLASCTQATAPPTQMPCAEILDPQLTTMAIASIDQSKAGAWIRTIYADARFTEVESGPGFYWSYQGRNYAAYFDGTIARIEYDLKPNARIADVLTCFGKPDYYRLDEQVGGPEASGTEFSMWYLKEGLVFKNVGFGHQAQSTYDANSALNHIFVVRPGTASDLVDSVHSISQRAQIITQLKPWPIDFTQISSSSSP